MQEWNASNRGAAAPWGTIELAAAGLDPANLAAARDQIEAAAPGAAYRVVIVRKGRIAAEWCGGIDADERIAIHSAVKSVHASMLGIALAEGRIASPEALLADVYPEALDVPEGRGPKRGSHVFDKDRAITLRQLLANVSGYMKPDERPGVVFHYQTYGMNVLAHAIGRAYGLYDPADPEASRYHELVSDRLRDPLGANWTYHQGNFALAPEARIGVFGYAENISASARDLARLGLMWCRGGKWGERQLVPEAWLHEATATSAELRHHAPLSDQRYGLGFWANDQGGLFPDLPRDLFAAWGSDRKTSSEIIAVVPSRDLVIALAPLPWIALDDARTAALLARIIAAAD